MHKIKSTLLLAAVALTLVTGCEDETPSVPATAATKIGGGWDTLRKFTFESHEYLMVDFSGAEAAGAICHSESCRCKTPASVEK